MCRKLFLLFCFVLVLGFTGNAWARVWDNEDIGAAALPGSASYDEVDGVWTVMGDAGDIWGGGDGFHYAYVPVSGDCNMTVNLAGMSMDELHAWAKAGIMLRETLEPGSKHAMMAMTGANGVQFLYRQFTGGGSAGPAPEITGEVPPEKLRIRRVGNRIYGAYWATIVQGLPGFGFMWKEESVVIPELNTDVYIGLAVCSQRGDMLCTADFNDVDWPAELYYRAWKLSPDDGVILPAEPVTLSWMAGDEADSHLVYFGTDPNAFPPAVPKALGDESFDTGALALEGGVTYYWRIDEVGPVVTTTGDVRSFKTLRAGTGTILGEIWFDIGGTAVSDLTGNPRYPHEPSDTMLLTSLEAPTDLADNFGARMIGYLHPETAGDYTFYIASDDDSELWLSTDETPCNARKIASVAGWASSRDWYSMDSQNSSHEDNEGGPIVLDPAEGPYYIMAIYKEGGGGDNCAVGWQTPDNPSIEVIDGFYLSTGYVDYWASNLSPADGVTLTPLEAETVSWARGATATSHNVYLGTDPGAMTLVANVPMPDTSYTLPTLALDTTYYWMVEADDGNTYPCSVYSFTTAEWVSIDIGRANPDPAGSSSFENGVYTLKSGGNELWGNADEFHFLYTTMKMVRDQGEIKARVLSIENPDSWRRAGVMIRETTAANSRKVLMHKTGHDNVRMQTRDNTGDGTWGGPEQWGTGFPTWVRITRDGNWFDGYYSLDGENWIHHGSRYVPMEAGKYVCVGLALCHHNSQDQAALSTGKFDNLIITTTDPHKAWIPSPEDGAENMPIDTTLSWVPGDDIMLHAVYFGDNYDDVAAGAGGTYKGLHAGEASYDPGLLDLTKTYYWCVDELWHDGRDMGVALGDVYSFTIVEHRVVDDFEAYDIVPEVLPEQVIIVEAVPPPDQLEVEFADTVVAVAPPDQSVVDPCYIIPGYTIAAVAPDDVNHMVAYWPLDVDFNDYSGSGFDGDPCNASIVIDGERNQVLSLAGDGYVDCGNPAALNFGTGDWSLSVWTKNTMTGTGDENKGSLITNGGDGGGGHRYGLVVSEQDEGKLTLVTDDDADKRQAKSGTSVNDDVWHHVLGVRDGDTIRLYIDGIEEATADLPDGYDLSGTVQSNVLLGAMTKASDLSIYKTYIGLIDDARIYNCALTEGNARFLAGLDDKVVDPIVVPATYGPMLVHYEFEGNANDSSGNSHHGTEMAGEDSNNVPTYDTVASGQAIRFADNGDHVLDDDAGLYMNGLSELTISAWIKSEKTDRDEGWIHFGTDWSDKRSFRYDKDGGSSSTLQEVIKYGVATNEGNEEDESSDYVQTTEWQHVAMTWQSGVGLKLYIDGVLNIPGWDADAKGGVTEGYSRTLVGKGSKDNSDDESWNGLVDEVRIYNIALTYGEIRYLAGQMDPLAIPPAYGPLIAEYTFDTDASDTSGNNLHGILIGDAKVEDGVLVLDGDGDCVDLGHHAEFNPRAGQFSFSLWMNMTEWGGGWGSNIVSKRGENGRGWVLRRRGDDNRLTFTTRGCGNDDPVGQIEISLNEWHHVVAVRDGDKKTLYIDGMVDNVAGINTNPITWSGHNAYIGARANRENTGIENYFKGRIDDVRLYNYALSEAEFRDEAGMGDLYGPLAAHYTFESGDASDSSGNNYDGTLIGDASIVDDNGNQVLNLDGDGDYVVVGPVGIRGSAPRTIAGWVKASTLDIQDWTNIFGFTSLNAGGDLSFDFNKMGGQNQYCIHVYGWEHNIMEIDLDWHHLAATYDGTTIRWYGDGELVGSEDRGLNTEGRVQIGKRAHEDKYFPGQLDDVRIYDYALSYGEVSTVSGIVPDNLLAGTWEDHGTAVSSVEWQSPHWGVQAMRIDYHASDDLVMRVYEVPALESNWAGGNAKALVLWFKGDPLNAPRDIFVRLQDADNPRHQARVFLEDPAATTAGDWEQWNIDLQAFTGVNVANVRTVEIGFRSTAEVVAAEAGDGTMYIDDMRLYTTRCVPALAPYADLTDDCKVDYADLRILADEWMIDYGSPGDPGLVYEYYEEWIFDNDIQDAPFDTTTPTKVGRINNFDISVRDRDDRFGFRFTGGVVAPADGDYTFYTSSDDGSMLYIDGEQVVDNRGWHGMQWREGTINLTAGVHSIVVTMFEDGGGEGLEVEVAGPGIPRTPIPNEVLVLTEDAISYLKAPPAADLYEDGIADFKDFAVIADEWLDVIMFP